MAKKQRSASSSMLEAQNAADTMFANIRFQAVDKPIKSIMLTSSVPDEGKTATAILLGQAIAASNCTVLLVEADLRRRSLATELNLHPQKGLYSLIMGEVDIAQAVVPTPTPNMYFLDVEPGIPNPADVLGSTRMDKLIGQLANRYDYVLYDTCPVGGFVDAAVLASHVDGTILVTRPNFVKRSELQHSYEQLVKGKAHFLGLCETFAEYKNNNYYSEYYAKGGDSKRRGKANVSDAPVRQSTPGTGFAPSAQAARGSYAGGAHRQTAAGGSGAHGSAMPAYRGQTATPQQAAAQSQRGFAQQNRSASETVAMPPQGRGRRR